MVKTKVYPEAQDEGVQENEATSPSKRTRRQTKNRVMKQKSQSSSSSPEPELYSCSETIALAEANENVHSSPLSTPPREMKSKPGRRKSSLTKAISRSSAASIDVLPSSHLQQEASRRRGGNKRKHTHEYCLTCKNYGRACGGRRDGQEGCAVCREPNRDKGEKLRECLWADTEAGIFTYEQAREVHKKAQAAERLAKGKAPTKRQLQYLNDEDLSKMTADYLKQPDPLGLVEPYRPPSNVAPPPTSRALDVLPPPIETMLAPHFDSTHDRSSLAAAYGIGRDTTIANTLADGCSHTQQRQPRIRQSGVTQLHSNSALSVGGGETLNDHQRMLPLPWKTPADQPTDRDGHRVPYYDPNLNAFVLPAYPYSNLLPPHMQGTVTNQTYISPYDAYPCIPILVSDTNPPRPVIYRPDLPPPNASYNIPKPSYSKPRPLDKTGQPCRKWSRSNSTVKNVGGYPLQMRGWKAEPQNKSEEDTNRDMELTAIESNVVSTKADTNQDAAVTDISDPDSDGSSHDGIARIFNNRKSKGIHKISPAQQSEDVDRGKCGNQLGYTRQLPEPTRSKASNTSKALSEAEMPSSATRIPARNTDEEYDYSSDDDFTSHEGRVNAAPTGG